jgi:hypothetical protein
VASPLRWRQLVTGPALVLAAALAAAGCASATAGTSSTSANAPARAAAAITMAQASQAFNSYVATTAKAWRAKNSALALSVVTGAQQAIVSAGLKMDGAHGASSGSAAYSGVLTIESARYTYGAPTFYLPEPAGYPRFFVADVTRAAVGSNPSDGVATWVGGAEVPVDGPVLMLFQQSTAAGPWQLASVSQFPPGMTLPRLATDKNGYIPQVPLTSTGLLAQPYATGPLQAAVADDGPASAATKAVAAGPLTTGLYQGARDRVSTGLQAPRGDIFQWAMQGAGYPAFALQTANGGALVLYAMYLNSTVAVPSYINKADPIDPGPPIEVPLALSLLLPADQPTPRVQLEAQELLSFAAIDPPMGPSKIQVIAIGGGINYAAAS